MAEEDHSLAEDEGGTSVPWGLDPRYLTCSIPGYTEGVTFTDAMVLAGARTAQAQMDVDSFATAVRGAKLVYAAMVKATKSPGNT